MSSVWECGVLMSTVDVTLGLLFALSRRPCCADHAYIDGSPVPWGCTVVRHLETVYVTVAVEVDGEPAGAVPVAEKVAV